MPGTLPSASAVCILTALACIHSLPARAQFDPVATVSLGQGYGQIALSQGALNNARELTAEPGSRASNATKPETAPASGDPATLTYEPDPRLSGQTRTAMIEALSAPNPRLRPQIERAFAGDAVLKQFDQFMSGRGYSSRNAADSMAELLVTCWEIVTDGTANAAQIQGAHRQTRNIFRSTPRLQVMTNAERQEMSERIAYQIILSSTAHEEYLRTGDRAQQGQLKQAANTMMRQQGIDLSQLQLTERGFSKASGSP